MTPAEVLAAARDLLARPAGTGVGGWPRAVALLTRQALEQAIEGFWKTSPATAGLGDCTRKTQLTCLPTYLEPAVAHQISYVWAALSAACHYHPYELAPTGSQLSGWTDTVGGLLVALGQAPEAVDIAQDPPAADLRVVRRTA
jgi:hypothetical protein